MIEVREYLAADGASPYRRWFGRLNAEAAARVTIGRDGDRLVILLDGGTKKRQQADIAAAQELWADYKRRKAQER